MKRYRSGFTLVEIVVVVSIIGILASVVYANFGLGSAQSRDAKRQADLRLLQNAVEQYKQRYGRYPEGCNTGNAPNTVYWSRQAGGVGNLCPSNRPDYIVGLAPEFIPVLPTDPRIGDISGSGGKGYVYITNANGDVYKIMAEGTVETEDVRYGHEFARCDIRPNQENANTPLEGGMCVRYCNGFPDANNCTPIRPGAGTVTVCSERADASPTNPTFSPHLPFVKTYAVSGGFAPLRPSVLGSVADHVADPLSPNPFPAPAANNNAQRNIINALRDTARIRCQ